MSKKNKGLLYSAVILTIFCLSYFPAQAQNHQYDLSLDASDIRFSKDVLIAGETVRIYATVRNVGSEDIVGYVSFLKGAKLIGNSQPVSVLPGKSDDVFVDFEIPDVAFTILAKIQGTEPADQNSLNNDNQSNLITPEHDTDGDGIVDSQDDDDDNDGLLDSRESDNQCPYRLKADSDNDGVNDGNDIFPCNSNESKDTDGDGQGDNADIDDDNDGWSDSQEQSRGTDPLRADTDGDGVNDPQDAYPLDSTKSQVERNIFQPPVNNNTNQASADEPLPNQTPPTSQENQEIDAVTQEVKDLIESSETVGQADQQSAAESDQAELNQELGEVVERVAGTNQSFFRLDNLLLWLLIFIVIVLGVISVILFKGKGTFEKSEEETEETPAISEKPKEKFIFKSKEPAREQVIKIEKPAEPAPRPPVFPSNRPSDHVIDLKKMGK